MFTFATPISLLLLLHLFASCCDWLNNKYVQTGNELFVENSCSKSQVHIHAVGYYSFGSRVCLCVCVCAVCTAVKDLCDVFIVIRSGLSTEKSYLIT